MCTSKFVQQAMYRNKSCTTCHVIPSKMFLQVPYYQKLCASYVGYLYVRLGIGFCPHNVICDVIWNLNLHLEKHVELLRIPNINNENFF